MKVISKKDALELQRIIKETIGKKLELPQVYALWSYISKLLIFIWKINNKNSRNRKQKVLFDPK